MWSSVKRLTSEMEALENESNRFVPSKEYYVVRVQLENTDNLSGEKVKNFAVGNVVPRHYSLTSDCLIKSHSKKVTPITVPKAALVSSQAKNLYNEYIYR